MIRNFSKYKSALRVVILELAVLYGGTLTITFVSFLLAQLTHRPLPSHQAIFLVSAPILLGVSRGLGAYLRDASTSFDRSSMLQGSLAFLSIHVLLSLPSKGEELANVAYALALGITVAIGVVTAFWKARPALPADKQNSSNH